MTDVRQHRIWLDDFVEINCQKVEISYQHITYSISGSGQIIQRLTKDSN